ncbi:MAG: YraN family protein [Verrucomicrobia bacterium]|nr:YraN family protein [Verrucomicrobiota bacterium]
MADSKQQSGLWGEKLAARHLKRNGYRLLGKRVRFGPRDEIDIVARQGETVIFVEVKTRKSEAYGRPADHVGKAKRRTQSRAAMEYLRRCKFRPVYVRFDIVEVIGEPGDRQPELRHIENAFTLEGPFRLPM